MEGRLIGDGREFVVQLAIASLFLSFYVCFTSFLPRPTYYFLFSSANARGGWTRFLDSRDSSPRIHIFSNVPRANSPGACSPPPPPRGIRKKRANIGGVCPRTSASQPSDCRLFRDKLTTVSPCGRTMEREKSRGARGGGEENLLFKHSRFRQTIDTFLPWRRALAPVELHLARRVVRDQSENTSRKTERAQVT